MKTHNVVVGIFVTAAIVLFAACLFLIGNQHKAFNRHIVFYANFKSVDGLPKGATVRVDGMDAGDDAGKVIHHGTDLGAIAQHIQ